MQGHGHGQLHSIGMQRRGQWQRQGQWQGQGLDIHGQMQLQGFGGLQVHRQALGLGRQGQGQGQGQGGGMQGQGEGEGQGLGLQGEVLDIHGLDLGMRQQRKVGSQVQVGSQGQ